MTAPNLPEPPGTPHGHENTKVPPIAPRDTDYDPNQRNASTGQFNPNIRIDTSTTTSSGPSYRDLNPRTGARADNGSDLTAPPSHYDVGHAIGSAIGQHIQNQILAEIQSWFK